MLRRDFLAAGPALALTAGPRAKAEPPAGRAKSVVWLWLGGGPSQLDTLDPKPDAPAEVRGTTGIVRTSLPGIMLGGSFPELAKRMHRLAVVRSFGHHTTDHTAASHLLLTGSDRPDHRPGLGAIVARHRGSSYVRMGAIRGDGAAWLGSACEPLDRSEPAAAGLTDRLRTARRLCEAGAGFVTVVNANWDFHARKNIPNMPEGMGVFAPPLDHAVSAFLEDVKARGLEDKILLVVTGEFGRTPGLDKNLGRHHWAKICPLVFAGGGLTHGQVVGNSDRRGGEPATEPVTISDLHATILHTLFDVGRMRTEVGVPAAVLDRATKGTPIKELFS